MELTRNQRCREGLFLAIVCPALAAFFVASAGRLEAVDFLRGDVNGDREVSFADGGALLGFLFYSFPSTLECLDAADKNDNGTVDISDAIGVLTYVTQHAAAPAEPFPVPGPDPTPDRIGIEHCGSYGGGSFLDDAAALIKLSGAPAAGGEDSRAEIVIEISNSASVVGYHGKIGLPDGLVSRVNVPWREDILVGNDYFYMLAGLNETTLEFSFLGPILSNRTPIPAGSEVAVLRIPICLREGTAAGEYPLSLEFGELVDYESGRAIRPDLAGGTLRVLSDVTSTEGCARAGEEDPKRPSPGGCQSRPEELVPVPAQDIVDVGVTFRLEDATAQPGDSVGITFTVLSDRTIQGLSFSIDFDESVLELTSVEKIWTRTDGEPFFFEVFGIDNENKIPGDSGLEEGHVIGAFVFDVYCDDWDLPAGREVEVAELNFLVRPRADPGKTEIRIVDGAPANGGNPVGNMVTVDGETVIPELATSFVFVDSTLNIVPGVTTFNKFIRGDANGDKLVDMADAMSILSHLFLGGFRIRCLDAGDANDDGALDISDPITILEHLFLGTRKIPAPGPRAPDEDRTEDTLDCAHGTHE